MWMMQGVGWGIYGLMGDIHQLPAITVLKTMIYFKYQETPKPLSGHF